MSDRGMADEEAEGMTDEEADPSAVVDALLAGDERTLARVISRIENRAEGVRPVLARLSRHAGEAAVIGITGAPGAGKSTLVDGLVDAYRDRDLTVGVLAIDPSSPYSGGAVLGDRIRMHRDGDAGVFVRSMSARGRLGGLSRAAAEAVTVLDAAGFDVVLIETVGAGQNEVDVVRAADTVAVLVQPESGDDVQLLKAGVLEIADVFVVNKADLEGAGRTVARLEEMRRVRKRAGSSSGIDSGDRHDDAWTPPIVETVATTGTGVADLIDALDSHREHLLATDDLATTTRSRHAATIRALLRADLEALLETTLERQGGIDDLVRRVEAGETDPYAAVESVVAPIEDCLDDR
ncbi:methylmalonyl Co-A mutase-associated GTPase MeaB [Halopenitus persicus]|uniref:LAO/AO transport system kinase n=1 Tax=Halopenitus persicus TaxID=1048396 RepID=A0A1H3IHV0_9EURY|nr:methylmalonyl Co-A mutase-associated GTPase MeaB [Halopenitus persicus]SDY26648.1 LAO/AO transport system kinase [Halopenitus persicus]